MNKLKEDIFDLRDQEVSDDKISDAKKKVIKTALGEEDLDLDNLSDEQLDQLLGKASTMEEKIKTIVENMELLEASDFDIKEALRVHTGMKLSEAAEVLEDLRLNG